MAVTDLPNRVRSVLSDRADSQHLQRALEAIATEFGAVTATLHTSDVSDPGAPMLRMRAYLGLPEKLLPITQQIPYGKGMAGLCVERREPITVCNLQTDASGAVRPGAKLTGVEGAIAIPIFAPGHEADREQIIGTFGIGKPGEHTYTDEEQAALVACAHAFAHALALEPERATSSSRHAHVPAASSAHARVPGVLHA